MQAHPNRHQQVHSIRLVVVVPKELGRGECFLSPSICHPAVESFRSTLNYCTLQSIYSTRTWNHVWSRRVKCTPRSEKKAAGWKKDMCCIPPTNAQTTGVLHALNTEIHSNFLIMLQSNIAKAVEPKVGLLCERALEMNKNHISFSNHNKKNAWKFSAEKTTMITQCCCIS